ncbi:hypothetical protein [Prosthecobacter sp.]|uniref:hypothetical protein n=1 Tax=Prosthecobacter sp. TaxID=1965333 RepID=UPI003783C5D6
MCLTRRLLLLLLLSIPAHAENMSWLENDRLRLGVDLDLGGAITFLAGTKDRANVINNFDLGRQVQLSFFSGPVPFEANGQKPSEHWRHIGWNPIQTGDDFKNASRILAHENDGKRIHLTCVPLQWPLNNIPGECTFESWLELDGAVVKARARLNNARSDHTQYPARLQELPAVYANAAFPRVVSYTGTKPFTNDAVSLIPKSETKHPWTFWTGTERWAALLDDTDHGLGLITPGRVHFTGGFAGKPGPNDTRGNSTGYLAGQGLEILDHNIAYEFRYELVLGSLEEIRQRAATHRPQVPPVWTFTQDRQGWHYQNASDTGWPVKGHLNLLLEEDDPQLISPMDFWQAAEAPYLVLDAAFHTTQKQGVLMWQPHGEKGFLPAHAVTFPLVADGEFHRHIIPLKSNSAYQGAILRLRIDPIGKGEPGAWMKVHDVRLSASPE